MIMRENIHHTTNCEDKLSLFELTSFILPAGVLLLSAIKEVAAQSADPTPFERQRLGLAPCSKSVSTA